MKNFNFLQPQISQPKLHQIKHVGGVLESSQWADFKTAIGCQIWSRFHIEKGQNWCPILKAAYCMFKCIKTNFDSNDAWRKTSMNNELDNASMNDDLNWVML